MALPFLTGLLQRLVDLISPFIAPIKGLIKLVAHFRDTIKSVIDKATDTVDTSRQIVAELKQFSLKPHFKSRVINGPRALKNLQDLLNAIRDIGVEFKTLKNLLKEKLGADTATEDLASEEVEGIEDVKAGLTKIGGRLSELGGKILGWATFVLQIISDIDTQLDAINKLIHDILTIVQDLDHLNGIFLQQNNPRKTLQTDQGPIRIRVGSLHSSA